MMVKSLVFCGFLGVPVMVVLYFLGLGFFAYYHAPENAALLASLNELVATTKNTNMVLPHFVRHVMPPGLGGLVFAGLFAATMSVFSSGLNSLSTATCMDFITRLRRLRGDASDVSLRDARWITLGWGTAITLAAIAVHFAQMDTQLLETAAAIIGFFSGPLLGMFLLGIFTTRVNSLGAIAGAILGFVTAVLLWHEVSFIWYAVTGCVPTLVFGYLFSFLAAAPDPAAIAPMTLAGRGAAPSPRAAESDQPAGVETSVSAEE
jgi:Na+/proline symporter